VKITSSFQFFFPNNEQELIELLIFLNFRWKVRIFDGSESSKEGWIPAHVLDYQRTETAIFGEKSDDAAYRRE
jgi:hypothetical protein